MWSVGSPNSSRDARERIVVENGPSARPPVKEIMNVVYFIIAFAFFLLGIFLFAFAFDVQGYQAVMFLGGIAAISISLFIPFHILGHGEQR
jgi:hypothetical protein